jgi:hypothetical protein
VYDALIGDLVSRALSMQNRNPLSRSYGCLDRNFWHLKTLVDFPSATYQQALLGLSALWGEGLEGNPYYKTRDAGEAVRSGVLYWCSIQNTDGSFNEYYQNDRSFCPTAFTTFGVASAFDTCREIFSEAEADRVIESLSRSAVWLSNQNNLSVMNQMIASMLSLRLVSELTGSDALLNAFEKRREDVLEAQTEEGWFPEYGGADVGYSFMVLDLFSLYLMRWPDARIVAAGERLIQFLSSFLHPDGTAGGHYGSRCTQHVFPFGVEYFAKTGSVCGQKIRGWLRAHLMEGAGLSPLSIDDKYVAYFYFNSFVLAHLHADPMEVSREVGPEVSDTVDLPEARIIKVANSRIRGWVGYGRNGVCRFFDRKTLLHVDAGYVLRTADGRLCATQMTDPSASMDLLCDGERREVTVAGTAGYVDDSHPLERWIVPFKLFCRTILRSNTAAYWFHRFIKSKKIATHVRAPVTVIRKFSFDDDALCIQDVLESSIRIEEAILLRDVTTVHSPSSRYYLTESLNCADPEVHVDRTPNRLQFDYRIPLVKETPVCPNL